MIVNPQIGGLYKNKNLQDTYLFVTEVGDGIVRYHIYSTQEDVNGAKSYSSIYYFWELVAND